MNGWMFFSCHWFVCWTNICIFLVRILFSTPFAVITYILLWFVFPFENGKFIWCLIFYCLFQTMQTVGIRVRLFLVFVVALLLIWRACVCVYFQCFHVPYSALTMFITSDQKERDSATAYRMSTPRCLFTAVTRGWLHWAHVFVILDVLVFYTLQEVIYD